ncbi:MAG: DUF1476 domain-containing protein [Alphaproteobacteria bacterium]|nr:DUF1476 domain-containing protein [Alphaproteobacteria bacterium]
MTSFEDRERAFENKFALDEALMFKAEARACKLFGLWLSEQMDMSAEEAGEFASDLITANLEEPGFDDVKRAAAPKMLEKGFALSEEDVDAKLQELFVEAQQQIKNEAA